MTLLSRIKTKVRTYRENIKYPHLDPGCKVPANIIISRRDNLVMMEGSELESGVLILNVHAKFIMGKYSCAGPNLTVITGNHMSLIGKYLTQVTDEDKKMYDTTGDQDKDVVLEEDVWLGANVVLLKGVRVGRGAVVAAGTVCRTKIPPYAIVVGNPAKVVGFRFTPEQLQEHEKILYSEQDRISLMQYEKNYKKYYLNRLKEINDYCRI